MINAKKNILGRSNPLIMDLLLTDKELFVPQYVNGWTGVVWITGILLSAVWTLILMAPIHSTIENK